jgi:hypothetical protein
MNTYQLIEFLDDSTLSECFNNFMYELYAVDKSFVSSNNHLNKEYLQGCYLFKSGHKILARACLYINPYHSKASEKIICIGNYECINEQSIAVEFLHRIFFRAQDLGFSEMIGPLNGSTWDAYKFNLDHDYPLFFLESQQQHYYNEQFIASGFKPLQRYVSSIDKEMHSSDMLSMRENELLKEGLHFRNIKMMHFKDEIERIYNLCREAFLENFLYSPISLDAFMEKYTKVFPFLKEDQIMLAENEKTELQGFIFCLNDHYNMNNKSLIIKTLARKKNNLYKGLGAVLVNKAYQYAIENKYTSIIHAFMIHSSTSTKISASFLGHPYKSYLLYSKGLSGQEKA